MWWIWEQRSDTRYAHRSPKPSQAVSFQGLSGPFLWCPALSREVVVRVGRLVSVIAAVILAALVTSGGPAAG
jgi:hypothetical protein